jgi:ribosomal protein S10
MPITVKDLVGENMSGPMLPREMRDQNPTADDAMALMRGAGYVVKSGKQTICYCQSHREALFEAGKAGAVAYKITKEITIGRPAAIYLTRLDSSVDSDVETVSEKIADYAREQIGATYGPMSPLSKQRVVFTIYPVVDGNKDLAYDAYELLYPSSNKEQFNRFWEIIDSSNIKKYNSAKSNSTKTNNTINTSENSSNSRESIVQYAESHGLSNVLSEVLRKNIKICVEVCRVEDISLSVFENLLNKARILGEISDVDFDSFMKAVGNDISLRSVERRIGGDILSMVSNNPTIMNMVKSGNDDGISDILCSMGYSQFESNELAIEIVSLGRLIGSLK